MNQTHETKKNASRAKTVRAVFSSGEDCKTAKNGVFVAGDCRTKTHRQLTTAAADGTVAALNACTFLEEVTNG